MGRVIPEPTAESTGCFNSRFDLERGALVQIWLRSRENYRAALRFSVFQGGVHHLVAPPLAGDALRGTFAGVLTRQAQRGASDGGDATFNGVKVFSATMFADRERLGDKVTAWMAENPRREVADIVVTQSSDAAFHCIAVTVFYREPARELPRS